MNLLPLLLAAAVVSVPPAAAQPAPLHATAQVAANYRLMIGDARVTALSDGTVPIDLHQLLRGTTEQRIDDLLRQNFQTNPAEASINAYLIELSGRRILVDAGAGDVFGPGNGGRLPQALAAVGVTPGQITDILLTHVHSDHSGGLVRNGRMLFPNAIVHAGRPDVDFFLDAGNAKRTGYDQRYFDEARKTLGPYVDAGRVRPFEATGEILPGIVAELHPGHTPGSAFYVLTSKGERIVFVGDIVHAAAVQLPQPTVTITFDQDQDRARAVRREALTRFAADEVLLAAPHIAFPGIGHVTHDGAGYGWIPVEFADRQPGSAAPDLKAKPVLSTSR
ncbi:MBL fold metallo-hydrolase [Sphingomonas aerophila]|uniref:Glyoxylase-like metal-dependent hydrolase (Beta-lactamase superfamily II) n=1 Tax=Sphingomonas aerophila TaxID=1344948 RepID=A0A7W9BBG7_9SPHN|nr:MBL fold metallo-hydrolase [Sphingomonas aerophila]MBB5714137.1 glyoxylase-like metal-dependent hydrolase (beta-lactamase superfamily II) [Sphingomonas aerophila]